MIRQALSALSLVALTACSIPGAAPEPAPASEAPTAPATTPSSVPASSPAAPPAQEASAAAGDSCTAKAETLTSAEQAGQLLMVGVSTRGLDSGTADAITATKAGSVVLLGENTVPKEDITELSVAIAELDTEIPILVSVDQEGGEIQRLRGEGFTRIPSAVEQGKLSPTELAAAAKEWGSELREAGVLYDLAPSADVVPADNVASNAPIGRLQRHFGTEPEPVGESVGAFVEGMTEAGIATSLKHFPGLGRVRENTDFAVAIDDETTVDDPFLAAFEAGIEVGASSVMISSAVFTQIDPDNEGVFSERLIEELLRDELGFEGVVIADDLGAAKSVADVAPGDRAVRFLEAGGDLVINADPSIAEEMAEAVTERIESDPEFAESAAQSVARVLALKQSVDLDAC